MKLFATLTLSDKNSWYQFTTTSIVGAGCIIGPVVSGVLCESTASWRWVSSLSTRTACERAESLTEADILRATHSPWCPESHLHLPSPFAPEAERNSLPYKIAATRLAGNIITSGGVDEFRSSNHLWRLSLRLVITSNGCRPCPLSNLNVGIFCNTIQAHMYHVLRTAVSNIISLHYSTRAPLLHDSFGERCSPHLRLLYPSTLSVRVWR